MAILKLKIELKDIFPKIWRTFLVEDSITFQQLHDIIQKVMGWENYHMYEFNIGDETILCSDNDKFNPAEGTFRKIFQSPEAIKMLEQNANEGLGVLDINKLNQVLRDSEKNKPQKNLNENTKINTLITEKGQEFIYTYDFGDKWNHLLIVEGIAEKDLSKKYPLCLDGSRACPPEDCGGPYRYSDLMKIRKNKKHPRYQEMIEEWLGEDYSPELFVIDWTNAILQGKKPKPGWAINKQDNDIGTSSVPLGKLLKDDSKSAKEIKTLFGKEDDYQDYLGRIEFAIADYFMDNRKLKDKDVEIALKNLKKNYTQNIDFFKTDLEKEIISELSLALGENSISHHELKLVFDYILWAIDNRSWIGNNQAYVKWLPFFFEIYDDKEMKEYEKHLIKICQRHGIPQNKINDLLNMSDESLSNEEKENSKIESEFFAIGDDKKFDFVIVHCLENPFLLELYNDELEKKGDFVSIEKLYKKMMELTSNFPLFEFALGINYYSNMKNPTLGKHHIENAIRTMETVSDKLSKNEEMEIMLKEMKQELKELGITDN